MVSTPAGWQRVDTYTYDKVGNRLSLIRQTADAQTEVVYEYNDADQLTRETQTVLQALPGGGYAAAQRPQKSAGVTLGVLAVATFTFMLAPFALLRTNVGGRRARRNRRFIAVVSAFFVPLMAVSPAQVCALQNESLAYQALAAAGMATVDPNTTVTEYGYDSNGNMVTKTVNAGGTETTTEYTYDAENRLITVDKGEGAINLTTYTYDDDGIRTSKRVGNNLTTYVVDKNRDYAQVLEERNELGEVIKRYVYGHDLISQTNSPGQPEEAVMYFHYDGQMSTRALSEGTTSAPFYGYKLGSINYDAFGVVQDRQGSINVDDATNYLYTGEQHDANAGFYYLRARYYSPDVGRFITRDTYQGSRFDPRSLHKYLYCNADPMNRFDPSGLMTLPEISVANFLRSFTMARLITVVKSFAIGATVSVLVDIGFNWLGFQDKNGWDIFKSAIISGATAAVAGPGLGLIKKFFRTAGYASYFARALIQAYDMGMLQAIIATVSTVIDYELNKPEGALHLSKHQIAYIFAITWASQVLLNKLANGSFSKIAKKMKETMKNADGEIWEEFNERAQSLKAGMEYKWYQGKVIDESSALGFFELISSADLPQTGLITAVSEKIAASVVALQF